MKEHEGSRFVQVAPPAPFPVVPQKLNPEGSRPGSRALGRGVSGGLFVALLLDICVAGPAWAAPGGFSIDTQDRFLAREFYNSAYTASEGIDPAWTGDLTTCTAGTTAPAFRNAVVTRINYFRAMAGVPASVTLSNEYNNKAQEAALMMSRNNTLSHFPPATWTCWSQSGADAASNSNLSLGSRGPDAVANQMRDNGPNNRAVGHRRWLLFPQTQEMGTGDIPATAKDLAANAVWVFDSHYYDVRPTPRDSFVAWPPPGYVPYQVIYPRWSFSYPGADFSVATVSLKRNGMMVPLTLEAPDIGAGENSLVWIPQGRDPIGSEDNWSKPTEDVNFDVAVSGVRIGGLPRTFNYRVVAIDPARAGTDESVPTISGPTQVAVTQSLGYSFPAIPHATGYQLSVVALAAYARVEGAEPGTLAAIIDGTTAGYSLTSTGVFATGTASFHLAQPHGNPEFFALADRLLVGPGASLNFKSRLGWATTDQVARVQVSLDDGRSWQDLWTQAGTDNAGETGFTPRSLSLADFVGRVVNLRFLYDFEQGSYYYNTADGVGFYVDDIQISGFERIASETLKNLGGNSFTASAANPGRVGYRVRARVWDGLPLLGWGPVTAVQVVAVQPIATLTISKTGDGTGWVSSAPPGIACGSVCSANFSLGATVTLTATATADSIFAGWTGGCSGTDTCTVILDAAQTVSATFNPVWDADGDAIPDQWELDHGLDPTRPDGGLDPDQDGFTNLTEYRQGTDPHDPKDFPRGLLMPSHGGWRALLH